MRRSMPVSVLGLRLKVLNDGAEYVAKEPEVRGHAVRGLEGPAMADIVGDHVGDWRLGGEWVVVSLCEFGFKLASLLLRYLQRFRFKATTMSLAVCTPLKPIHVAAFLQTCHGSCAPWAPGPVVQVPCISLGTILGTVPGFCPTKKGPAIYASPLISYGSGGRIRFDSIDPIVRIPVQGRGLDRNEADD